MSTSTAARAAFAPRVTIMDRDEEDAWLQRARAGDERAFAWLLARYRDRAVRLAEQILGRSGEAEDAAQDAFVRAFRGIGGLRAGTRFYTWLYRIVVRVCLNRRSLARWELEVVCDAPAIAPPADMTGDPGIERLFIEALLRQLTPPLRAALVLRELDGLEYEEIAAILNVPVGTVRSRLHAARGRLREIMTAANEEEARV